MFELVLENVNNDGAVELVSVPVLNLRHACNVVSNHVQKNKIVVFSRNESGMVAARGVAFAKISVAGDVLNLDGKKACDDDEIEAFELFAVLQLPEFEEWLKSKGKKVLSETDGSAEAVESIMKDMSVWLKEFSVDTDKQKG